MDVRGIHSPKLFTTKNTPFLTSPCNFSTEAIRITYHCCTEDKLSFLMLRITNQIQFPDRLFLVMSHSEKVQTWNLCLIATRGNISAVPNMPSTKPLNNSNFSAVPNMLLNIRGLNIT